MSAPHFHIHTFGCRVNRVESDSIAARLMEQGWTPAERPEEADVVIVNTCTVTGEADSKNRKAIRQALKRMDGPVVVTGCSANIEVRIYQQMDPRVHCECDKEKVPALVMALHESAVQAAASPIVRYGDGFRTRTGIKIQDGCDNACTFCIVHVARGKGRSLPVDDVMAEARILMDAGAEELVLVGIDLGAYEHEGVTLDQLAGMLLDAGAKRIRISSIEPQSISDGLIQLLSTADGRLCRHLHVAMQSGSSKVLRQMARHYDADQFRGLIARIRKAVPGMALSTDVIVGFPGETEEEFQETCQMVRDCSFMRLHVFPYSMRPGTPAAARSDQVAPEVKADRAARLAALGKELAMEDMKSRIGSVEGVVVERPGRGTSESFHEVRFAQNIEAGKLVPMRLTGIDQEHECLLGEPA